MKRTIFILSMVLCVLTSAVFAQQYDVNRETYKIKMKKFPRYYVEDENYKFFLTVQQNGIKNVFGESAIKTEFEFDRWTETDDKNAFMTITFSSSSVAFAPYEFKNNRSEKETPDGLQIINHFMPVIRYTHTIKAQFKCKYETFECVKSSGPPQNVYEVKIDFPTREEAVKYLAENKSSIISEIASKNMREFFTEVQKIFAERFSETEGFETIPMNYLDAQKSPYKDVMKDAREKLRVEFENITVCDAPKKTCPNLERWVEQFQMIASDLDMSKPEQKKAKEAVLKNLFYICYVREELDDALMYAQILNDSFNAREASRLIRIVRTLQTDMERYGHSTRHYCD